jgi:hypothetical protein
MSAYEEHTLKEHPAHFITHLVFAPKTVLGDKLLQIIVMHIIKFLKAVHKGTVIINYALHLAFSSQIPQLEKKHNKTQDPLVSHDVKLCALTSSEFCCHKTDTIQNQDNFLHKKSIIQQKLSPFSGNKSFVCRQLSKCCVIRKNATKPKTVSLGYHMT